MGKALTALAVEKMMPGAARREIPDGLVAGLYLVVQPSGAKSWAIRYRSKGTTRKHTIGSWPKVDLAKAREEARSGLFNVTKGSDPAAEKKAARAAPKTPVDRDTIEKVVDSFVERHAKAKTKAATAKETERLLRKEVLPGWKGRRLPEITRADVHELLDGIVDRSAPILANRVLAALRKMCVWAVERGLIGVSPCEKVKAPSAERGRDRVLSDDEVKAFWAACEAIGWPFGPLFRVLLLTGQRRDEVANLRWSELDLDAGLWTLPRERAKNDQIHTVPLSGPVLAILRELPRVGEFVFSTNGRTPVSGFSKAKGRIDTAMAGDDGPAQSAWVFHDMRRTAASGMARLGIGLPVIERVLNHVSGSFGGIVGTYQRYTYADEKRHALDLWSEHVIDLNKPVDKTTTLGKPI